MQRNSINEYDISVIIPIFNAEMYLKKCLDCIINGNECSYEILMIDDGSSDASADICKKYQEEYAQCRLIQKQNGGSVSARNVGIKEATGRFLTFVDADDWVDEGYLDKAINILGGNEKIDILVWKMIYDKNGNLTPVGRHNNDRLMEQKEAVEEMFLWNYFRWELAGKIYRKDLFNDYLPEEGIKIAEDLDSNWILFNRANNVFFSSESKYYYIENSVSVSKVIDPIHNDSWKVYSGILSDDITKTERVKSILSKRVWESLWNTYRVSYFSDEYDEVRNCIEDTAEKIYRYSDLNASIIPQIWREYRSFKEATRYNVELNIEKIKDTNQQGRNFIYGCGNIGTYITTLCSYYDIDIDGYIVTESAPGKSFYSRPVFELTEYIEEPDDNIFLAMDKRKQQEVKGLLQSRNNINIIDIECWQ